MADCATYGDASAWTEANETLAMIVRLLEIGGTCVEAGGAGAAAWIALHGVERSGGNALQIGGMPGMCHANCTARAERETAVHEYGYALSTDGCWYEHSWLVEGAGRVLETTCPREIYLGLPLAVLPRAIRSLLRGSRWIELPGDETEEYRSAWDVESRRVPTIDRTRAATLLAAGQLPLAA